MKTQCHQYAFGKGDVRDGFSLIEVLLAISIAVGILVVALVYHHQATTLRTQLLEESERLAAVRQVMDRLSTDLRAALADSYQGFSGTSNTLRFAMASLPSTDYAIQTDLKIIHYLTTQTMDGTNMVVAGVTRMESPMVDFQTSPLTPALATADGDTNLVSTNLLTEPLTEMIHYMRFRFWDGSSWKESWDSRTPPAGLEVGLGFDALPLEENTDRYPYELFRRIIAIPGGMVAAESKTTTPEQPEPVPDFP